MSPFFYIFAFLVFLVFVFARPSKSAIFGIYQRPSRLYYLKFVLFYTFLATRQFVNKWKAKRTSKKDAVQKYIQYERPQTLSFHDQAIDAVYFNTSSKDGNVLMCGVARRPKGVCNAFLYLKVAGHNLMLSPKLPDTTLQQTADEEGTFDVEGISVNVIEPMKTWSIQYKGNMKDSEDYSKIMKVELNATWTASYKPFDFDVDMSAYSMARDVARETWSKDYFETLKDMHQTHYEQYGCLEAKVKINNEEFDITAQGLRDHSFGKHREWKNFHRYGLHFITLDNGDSFTVGTICKPVCFSSLTMGYICVKAENKIYPVDYCDLELFRHGENLIPPLDYAFQFKAGGKLYTIQIDVQDSPTFFIGPEHECRVVERLVKCKVNGVEGWGAAEWYYRNIDRNIVLH